MAKKILIADDEPNIVASLEFLLGKAGYAVRVARDGGEALALMAVDAPDAVLLDIMMPVRSGYQVCEAIRANRAWDGVKVVMLSAKGRDLEIERGLAAGADAFVTKPFSTKELLERMRALLDG